MIQGLDLREGAVAVYAGLRSIEGLRTIDDDTLRAMIDAAIAADIAYMENAGVEEGAPYDEDDAFSAISGALRKRFPARKALVASFVDDYLEAWEVYLESVGLIEWD